MSPLQALSRHAHTDEELCRLVAEHLGLGVPVPPAAAHRAVAEPAFADELLLVHGDALALARALADPANDRFLPGGDGSLTTAAPTPVDPRAQLPPLPSNSQMLRSAAQALTGWAQSGFATVEAGVAERRLAACRSCEHYVEPSDRAVHQMARLVGERGRVCRMCGCFIAHKVRLPESRCPVPAAADPARSRWDEPLGGRDA